MIKIKKGFIEVSGTDFDILTDITTFLIAISTKESLNKHMGRAAELADKYIKEEYNVSHNSSNES